MLRSVLALLLLLPLGLSFAVTYEEVQGESGARQIALLEQYLSENAGTDAGMALELINSIPPQTFLKTDPLQLQTIRVYQSKALLLQGNVDESLALLSNAFLFATEQKNDALMAKVLLYRSELYREQAQYDDALSDAKRLTLLLSDTPDGEQKARAMLNLAEVYFARLDYKKAFAQLLNAQEVYQNIEDGKGLAVVAGRIGAIYRSLGDFDNALENMLTSLEQIKKTSDKQKLAITYNNTAIIFKDLARYDEAIEMHINSLELKREINYERGMVYSYNNLGETSRLNGDIDAAKYYLAQAELLANKLNNRMLLGSTYLYLGRIKFGEGNYSGAREMLNEAMAIYRKRKSYSRIGEGLVELAKVTRILGDPQSAKTMLLEAIDAAQKAQKNVVLFDAYELLAETYNELGEFENAYQTLKTYQLERQKLFDLNSQRRIELLVVTNQVNEARRELKLSKQQAELTKSELNHKAAVRNWLFTVVVFVILSAWYFYNRSAQAKQLANETKARKALEEREQQLSLALWGSGDVLWDWDLTKGKILRRNNHALSSIPNEHQGASVYDFSEYLHRDDLAKLDDAINKVVLGEQDAFEVNYRVRSKTGDWFWVQDRGKAVERDGAGKAVRIVGTQHDINELKNHEKALEALNQELEQRVDVRTQELQQTVVQLKATQKSLIEAEKVAALSGVVSGLAHEINTPLGTAVTAVSLLNDQITKLLQQIEAESLRKQDLLSYLFEMNSSSELISRGVTRSATLVEKFKQVSVGTRSETLSECCIDEVIDAANYLASKYQHPAFSFEYKGQRGITFYSYRLALIQVVEALVINCFEHAFNEQDHAHLVIDFSEQETSFTLTIEDNGSGVEKEAKSKLFDPFFTTTRHKGSTGLGLNIVYSLVVHLFEGKISYFESSLGGAGFKLVLKKQRPD